MLKGGLAAAVTPLRDGGEALDEEAFAPYVDFLAAGGVDGLLALGTTGEGILLTADERRRAAELFVEAAAGWLQVAVHCGAQTTRETVALCAHAAEAGADAVAVIGPPYFALDADSLLAHFEAAARASAPIPFYLYEFKARTGYSIPLDVVAALRDRVDNVAGMKVSNKPFEAVEPYLLDGLDVFVGAEELIPLAVARGAAGFVSGLAAAFPELVVSALRTKDADAVIPARTMLERFPFQAALKVALAHRGVPVREYVRAPLRTLRPDERAELEAWLVSS